MRSGVVAFGPCFCLRGMELKIELRGLSHRAMFGELIEQASGLGYLVNAEDQHLLAAGRIAAVVGVVDVDLVLAEAHGGAAQHAGAIIEEGHGDVVLLEVGAQLAQYLEGAGRVVHHKARQALALLHVGLKGQDVHAVISQSAAESPQRAGLVQNRHRKFLCLRHCRSPSPCWLPGQNRWETDTRMILPVPSEEDFHPSAPKRGSAREPLHRPWGQTDAHTDWDAARMAWSRSAIRSSSSSMPIETRSRSGGRLRSFNCSAGTLAWDILLGRLIDELTLPKLTVM